MIVSCLQAASDVYAPISGEVLEVNEALADEPALVSPDKEGDRGWERHMNLPPATA